VASDLAIVTLAIGQKHRDLWSRYCQLSWQKYADKHGYDVIVIDENLDKSPLAVARAPAWQKCLILSDKRAERYRQIVLLDCDIIINAAIAPGITDVCPPESVGGVISGSHIHEDLRIVLLERLQRRPPAAQHNKDCWPDDQAKYYRHYGLEPIDAGIIQTGVLVASPQHHRDLFESVYHATYDNPHRTFEQVPLSHAILSAGVFRQINARFNSVFYETMLLNYPYLTDTNAPSYELLASAAVQVQFANNFFLHFAYIPDFVRFLPQQLASS